MTIPASKVKAICTESEIAIVRASRKGEIENLSPAEVQRLSGLAKKLADKWRGLGRSQSRAQSRKAGFGQTAANTALKAQIFRDALEAFQAKQAKLKHSTAMPAKQPPKKTKQHRTAEHRAVRAAVRKGMTAAEDLLDTSEQPKKVAPSAAKPAVAARRSTPVATPAAKQVGKPKASLKPPKAAKRSASTPIDSLRQKSAIASAKKSRMARSGKTTRLVSHVTARGKRAQARRDAKN